MHLSRRQFTAFMGSSISAYALAPALLASPRRILTARRDTFFEWKELRQGVHAGFGQGGNAGLIQTDAGAVLIDAKNAPFGTTLRREANAVGEPVVLLINTHHHADHTGGNHAFLSDNPVRVIMHPKAMPRVKDQLDRYTAQITGAPDRLNEDTAKEVRDEIIAAASQADGLESSDFAPVATLPKSMFEGTPLPLGDLSLKLTHIGAGHTDNDIFIHIPEHNLIHSGDLVFHKNHPFMDTSAGVTSTGWITSCRAMLKVCDADTIIIPGHGEITDADGIREQIRYFEVVREAAAKAIATKTTREDFVAMDLPVFKDYGFTQIKQRSLGTIYDEMLKEKQGG
jgi:cyclase